MSAAAPPVRSLLLYCAFETLALTAGFVACSSSGGGETSRPDATAPTYCQQRCANEVEAGTADGTYEQCLQECCLADPSGCEGVDAGFEAGHGVDSGGNPGDDSGSADAYVAPETGADGGTAVDGGTGDGGCAQPCGTTCCFGSEVCVAGQCTTACTTNTDCPSSAPCCAVQANGPSGCLVRDEGQGCACVTSSDCPNLGCCAPATNVAGDPVGPYVCKPDDGNPYDCCTGITTTCGGSFCCVKDSNGNEFCSLPCTSDATCGAAHCDPFTFGLETTCSGTQACGP